MNRKVFLAMIFACVVLFGLSAKASAATYWYACTVQQVGPTNGTVVFYLSNSPTTAIPRTFTGSKWFKATTTDANKMLATALTAMSLGKKVEISVETDLSTTTSSGSFEIKTMLLLN
ncbi:MAG: hypothetical protein AB7W37_18070 [Syntrophobacteraceae bacterium]